MKKLIKNYLLLLVVGLLTVSCSNDDDSSSTPVSNTIADFVSNNSNYSSLKAALDKAGLTSVLAGSDSFTVFAPDNDAFSVFLSANGFLTLNDVPDAVLEQVLLNHVVSGVNMSSSLSTGYVKTLAEESTTSNKIDMYINTSSGVQINGDAQVVQADISVDNGVIHAVNKVIGLPTVVTFATADSTFSTLVAALTRESSFTYVSTLSTGNGTSPAPFTVFAPTNNAFADLLVELEVSSLNDIATATLEATLNTHVVGGANILSNTLTNGMTVTTLGDTFTINTTSGVTFTDQNNRSGNVIVADVQSANGVIHVIDKVILPQLN
ncbi:fasciclin domain-containing protein [Pseudofulvibacter geojedonensis]|uniref:Fasciclin domain-containing protein n=1 Tax=Pseudofulvibacter geojedonensis TaxID=1123758 RepID=A0ABW3I2H4_9FLAO